MMDCSDGLILTFPWSAIPAYCHRPLSQLSRLLWFCLGFLRQKYRFALCSTSTSNPVSTHPSPWLLLPLLTSILSMSPWSLVHPAHAGVAALEPWHLLACAWWTLGVSQQSQPGFSFCAVSGQPNLAEWPPLLLTVVIWRGKQALWVSWTYIFSLCFFHKSWCLPSLKELPLLVYLQGLKVDSSLCQLILVRLKPSLPAQPFPRAFSVWLCPCQSAYGSSERLCPLDKRQWCGEVKGFL